MAAPRRATVNSQLARRGLLALVGASAVVVLSTTVGAEWRWHNPGLRVVLEVAGLCFVGVAALAMSLPSEQDVRPARDWIVAALLVMGLANAVFAVLPAATGTRLAVDRGLGYFPWAGSRYVAGILFLAAGAERPRLGLARTVSVGVFLLVVVELVVAGLGTRLDVPLVLLPGGEIEVTAWGAHAMIQAIPAFMFSVGAFLAARLHAEAGGAPVYGWVSLALALQVMTQIIGIVDPAALGPVITTADLLRTAVWACLLVGATLQVGWLYRNRSRAVRLQQQDLRRQERYVSELHRFAEQERDFRAIVNHELATPLATIRAYAHVLQSRAPDLPPSARQALRGIDGEVKRLSKLMMRMDDLRHLELDEPFCDLRPVRLIPLVEDAASFAHGLPGSTAVLTDVPDVRIQADPVRFGQLLRNLLTNAVRYTSEASPVRIDGLPREDGLLELCVIDDGPGIPAEERERVLGRYARGSTAGGVAGSGLGLYLALRTAEAHGGSLRIEDGPEGRGTKVVIELRMAL